ncbi:hypothetical protein E6R60_18350 [Streptomyces sp. A0642]|uniref:hypothetical protein n=1 Tax=Streptomyces sp. A0642 TaxID=2563100 RepID=UPI0010A27D0B|nr:hypothetical protein [Streptomyces sp. A0642]THA75005.1 hypothetical protein E6R60_18350 [Streptomyces sp. A0642]
MADEQHEWLDEEAAEKMLRRQSVDPVGGRPRQGAEGHEAGGREAEVLAAALDALARTARPAVGELPGEAAALAAFRAARPAAVRTTAVSAAADPVRAVRSAEADDPPGSGVLAPVHIRAAGAGTACRSADSRGPRPMRWSRPIRFGLVASLACCAIGGVAVAAGTGVLPVPFGRHVPAPATSVSAAASPEELGSGLPTDDETSAPPPGSRADGAASPDAPGTAPTGGPKIGRTDEGGHTTDAGGRVGDGTGGTPSGGAEDDPSGGVDATKGQDGGRDSGHDSGQDTGQDGATEDKSSAWYAKTLKACRDYRDGKLDDKRRSRLEALAKGARNLDRFCDRMIAQADGKSGDAQNGDGETGGGDPSGNGGASGGSGALPSIGFSTASPDPTTAAGSPASGDAHSPVPAPSLAAR